jgi:hypothetical protein
MTADELRAAIFEMSETANEWSVERKRAYVRAVLLSALELVEQRLPPQAEGIYQAFKIKGDCHPDSRGLRIEAHKALDDASIETSKRHLIRASLALCDASDDWQKGADLVDLIDDSLMIISSFARPDQLFEILVSKRDS